MTPTSNEILSISQLNRRVRDVLETAWPQVWVRGEISNFTRAASGHWYFTLKDADASVSAVMFRRQAQALGFTPKVGEQLELRATVTLYEARGDYQLQVDFIRRTGQGDRYAAFLALRDKIVAEGLCDATRKRSVRAVPRTVGVITSLAAAALQDVLTALARRSPHVRVIIYPAAVQGGQAAGQLRRALATAIARRELDGIDTLLLVRGGGSIEDLWSFNDEALARMVAASPLPVISGVGHETDFTLVDFVADVRAPTPTAAAELACQPRSAALAQVQAQLVALTRQHQRSVAQWALRLDRATLRLVSPMQRLAQQRQHLTGLTLRLQQHWAQARDVRRLRLTSATQMLGSLDPQQILARGYVLVRNAQGELVKQAQDLACGQALSLQFASGVVPVRVGQTPASATKMRKRQRPAQ